MPAVVDPSPVGGASHLGGHLVEREVERSHLVVGAASARITGPLETAVSSTLHGSVVLARIALVLDLHLDPDDSMVVLLESSQLLLT